MRRWKNCYRATCLLFLIGMPLHGKTDQGINAAVLRAVASMPAGGGYATTPHAMKQLSSAGAFRDGSLSVHSSIATPSFCSEATYLVFLKTIALLQEERKLQLGASALQALVPRQEADGEGIWGRWNANGPGVAHLFYELGLGVNFTDLTQAMPGDFLKIFWTDAIGAAEHGHLVIYLGMEKKGEVTYLHCWSSNKPDGYGKRTYPLSKMHHLIFSRLTNPQALERVASLNKRDAYLASLLSRSTSWSEVTQRCAINENRNISTDLD